MHRATMMLGAGLFAATAGQAHAHAPGADVPPVAAAASPDAPEPKPAVEDVFSTGFAKGRDRLDGAISTSSLKESEILKLAPQWIGELLRDIPDIRAEAHAGEGNANITIRGLPLASTGAKFVQPQEDGLPIFEFGDIAFRPPTASCAPT